MPLRVVKVMIETGVRISIIYTDEHLIGLHVRASNGVFAGQADMYGHSESLAEFADALRGFPRSQSDSREFELGTFDAEYAGGGAGFRFFCVDSVGHAVAEVRLRADAKVEGRLNDAMVLHVSVEAAAVDSFVVQLEQMTAVVGQVAFLEAAA